jgi:hypothetical protein
MVSRKQRFIEQAMRGDDSIRSLEDISEANQYEMASALAAGDERVIQLAGLSNEIERLTKAGSGPCRRAGQPEMARSAGAHGGTEGRRVIAPCRRD